MQLDRLSSRAAATGLWLAASLAAGGCAGPELASVQSTAPVAHTVFVGIDVFDGEAVLREQDVIVSGSVVDALGPTGSLAVPPEARRISGAGRTLLPGLVDSHAHLFSAGEKSGAPPSPAAIAGAFLYAGVTSILVAAGFDEASGLAASGALSPHLFTAGPGLTAPGGHPIPLLRALLPFPLSWAMTRRVASAEGADEAREQVARVADEEKPPFFKLVFDDLPPGAAPHLSIEALEAAIDEAGRRGLRPIVHATTPADAMTAAEAGASLMVHVPQRGLLSAGQVERLAELGTPFVSTVRLVSASWDLAERGATALEREMHPEALLDPWLREPRWELEGFSEEIDERHDEIARITEANFQALDAAGVPLFVGTDSGVHGVFPGSSLHRELGLLVRLGMSPLRALRAATSAPADYLDPSRSFGRVAPGQRADLLVVAGDPSLDIAALDAIEEVFLGGARLERRAAGTRR